MKLLEKLHSRKRLIDELHAMKAQNRRLVEDIARLHHELREPRYVAEAIMGRGINWYNYEELPYDQRMLYYNNAQSVLRNETFQNEIKTIFSDWVNHLATQSKDWNEVRDIRAMMNGVDMLRKRFAEIKNPEKQVSKENIHEAI